MSGEILGMSILIWVVTMYCAFWVGRHLGRCEIMRICDGAIDEARARMWEREQSDAQREAGNVKQQAPSVSDGGDKAGA